MWHSAHTFWILNTLLQTRSISHVLLWKLAKWVFATWRARWLIYRPKDRALNKFEASRPGVLCHPAPDAFTCMKQISVRSCQCHDGNRRRCSLACWSYVVIGAASSRADFCWAFEGEGLEAWQTSCLSKVSIIHEYRISGAKICSID